MVIVLEIKCGWIYLFSTIRDAESDLEAIDVENGEYEFCDDAGQRLIGKINDAGIVRLVPDGAPNPAIVDALVSKAVVLDRGCNGVNTLQDLRRAINRQNSN